MSCNYSCSEQRIRITFEEQYGSFGASGYNQEDEGCKIGLHCPANGTWERGWPVHCCEEKLQETKLSHEV